MTAPLTTTVADPLLNLDAAVGQRSATFRFLLVHGITGQQLGEIHPIRDSPASLTHDSGRTIPRAMRLNLGVVDMAAINPLTDRVLPSMLIGTQVWPLGRYMFSDQSKLKSSGGELGTAQLVDEMFIIDQEISTGFAPINSESVDGAVLDLLASVGSARPIVSNIEPSVFSATGSWSIGTTRGQILDALTTQGDYLKPWMDNAGVFRMRRTFNAATAVPQFDYDTNHLVYRDSIITSTDMLTAPNRYTITDNSGDNIPITATADIPTTAPHSIANRGFIIPKSDSLQLVSQEQAQTIADGLALTQSVLEHVSLSTPPDPRHDAYDVIVWQGAKWLQVGWSMELVEGGEMTHDLVKAYR